MRAVLVDTGVWYAAFDPRDQWHAEGEDQLDAMRPYRVIVPWPTMYETLRTRMVNRPLQLALFQKYLKSRPVEYVDDADYRDRAYDLTLESAPRQGRPISMVDWVIRLMIEDRNVRVTHLATFNPADFYDVCAARGVVII